MTFVEKKDKLLQKFEFNNFSEAMDFVNKVAKLSERLNHHPNIAIYSYKYVAIEIYTHSEDCITDKDYELANFIDKIK
ncbi:4a-hydroxytetrahydrobiopterin dehydratase [Candidatus Gracilibacteria bacterium]|nr:4a-hydroxytetrahydrobiopterin dehydratase [Candidatus Gracilibacteria bacterium]